jgi:hypothetical protein
MSTFSSLLMLNRMHVVSTWGMSCLHPAFMRALSPVPYRPAVPVRHAQEWSNLWRRPNLWCPPIFRQSLAAEISAPRPLIKKTVKEKVGQAGLLFKTPPPRTSRAWPLWRFIAEGRSTSKWHACWKGAGEGGVQEDSLRAVTASGYARTRGG